MATNTRQAVHSLILQGLEPLTSNLKPPPGKLA
jgi:hypothetical protein